MKRVANYLCLIALSFFTMAHADDFNTSQIYGLNTTKTLSTLDASKELKWEIGAILGGATYLGLVNWNWGSSNSFKIANEGWLGTDTGSAGADKFGHMYSSYLINELFTKMLIARTGNIEESAKKSAIFSTGIMLWVELFDGYSKDHGFSYQDIVFNSLGIGLSYLKNTVRGLDDKIDLRIEYHPTHNKDHPVTDYSGYTHSFVTKLGGFNKLKGTPLKYFELQLSYHTEGFQEDDEKHFKEKKAEVRFGIGINLSEVLFKPIDRHTSSYILDFADTFFKYYQAPGIYMTMPISTRKVSYTDE